MRILIFKIGAIGDVVMTLSAVEVIRSQWPHASITWVCGERAAPLLRCVTSIHTVLTVNEQDLFGGALGALRSLLSLRRTLSRRCFDLVLLGHSDRRYRIFFDFLGVRAERVAAFGRNSDERTAPVSGRYHGDEYRRLVTGVDDWRMQETAFPDVTVPPISEKLEGIIALVPGKLVALAPGGARNQLADDGVRRWPIDHYVGLAHRLRIKGHSVVLLGDQSDSWVRSAFLNSGVIDLIGATSLTDLLGILSRMDAVVTHDSGILHLAILLRKRVVALFGPTDPSGRVPRNSSAGVRVFWYGSALACCPCYDGKTFAKCDNNLCLDRIPVSEVEVAVEGFLGSSRERHDAK